MNTKTQPHAAHTPTPWYAEAPYSQEIRTHKPLNKYDDIVATVYGGYDDDTGAIRRANAALIVRACNEYDHLKEVEALHEPALREAKALRVKLDQAEKQNAALVAALEGMVSRYDDNSPEADAARAALAQAKGGTP